LVKLLIQPELDLDINKIYQGDCLGIMKEIPDKSIDLVLTDPPYGINENNKKNLSRGSRAKPIDYGDFTWDKKKIGKEYFNEIFRISKNQIIFGGNYYGAILGDTSCYLVWDKLNGNNHFADCELAWTSFNKAVRKFTFRWAGMLQQDMKNKEKRYHPTQKPIKLFEQILLKYSKENDIILDPFAGSGTTALACMSTNRHYILIEKEPKYYDMILQRIDETRGVMNSTELFNK